MARPRLLGPHVRHMSFATIKNVNNSDQFISQEPGFRASDAFSPKKNGNFMLFMNTRRNQTDECINTRVPSSIWPGECLKFQLPIQIPIKLDHQLLAWRITRNTYCRGRHPMWDSPPLIASALIRPGSHSATPNLISNPGFQNIPCLTHLGASAPLNKPGYIHTRHGLRYACVVLYSGATSYLRNLFLEVAFGIGTSPFSILFENVTFGCGRHAAVLETRMSTIERQPRTRDCTYWQ